MKTLKLTPSNLYKPLFTGKARYYICMGGRSSGRSYSASQLALYKLVADPYSRTAIMRYVLGDIRNSIFQEIRDRIEENELEKAVNIKENSLTFEYNLNGLRNKINGIGFRKSSGDQKSKLKSLASYNCVIIEEAEEVSEVDFLQLDDSLRTIKSDIVVILLLNPPDKKHWIIRRWFNLLPSEHEGFYIPQLRSDMADTIYIHGTYLQNKKNLNQSTIDNFERYRINNPDHYWNMIRGYVSDGKRGLIYKNAKPISLKEFNELPYASSYALDFGYTNHPTALVEIKEHNNNVWTRELIYETGMLNPHIAKRMEVLEISKDIEIIADSAEPKSIDELKEFGFNVIPAIKGPDSIRNGVSLMQQKEWFYTEDSVHTAEEIQAYVWALDKNKEPTNEPVDRDNHIMDAVRYNIQTRGTIIEPNIRHI